jgi:predicted nucleotidyltransferase component of viral defense system
MIDDTRLRTLARQTGVTAGLAEKNYVNSWILYALYTSPLADQLVFKGGTALSKLYFPEIWRFSEDLDFTATEPLPELDQRLDTAVTAIADRSGITLTVTNVHEAGDPIDYVQIDVQYDAVLGQRNTTDLDITFNEALAFPPVQHQHTVEDIPAFDLTAYSVEEIFVEKLRSLYQRARARDYYDIYRLLHQESFDDDAVADALRAKSRAHNVDLDLANGLPEDSREAVRQYWDQALDRLVQEKPAFDDVAHRINDYLLSLAETG